MGRAGGFLAIDLGATSGRAVLGRLAAGRLEIREVSRFPNGPVRAGGRLVWDWSRLLARIHEALTVAAATGGEVAGIAVDTWGVDFALLGKRGRILAPPISYRDPGIDGAMEDFLERVPREVVYERTGVQMMPINTLFQLHAMVRSGSSALSEAESLLFLPDFFAWLLAGTGLAERTVASTSQLLDARTGAWAGDLFEALGVDVSLMGEIVEPGARLGFLRDPVADATGAGPVPVYVTAGHDTAAAVAAVPADGEGFAFVSAGTWCLVGMETPEPVITPATLAANFTNEAGVGGRNRLLTNVTGFWILEECRRAWDADLEVLLRAAADAGPAAARIDPDDPAFRSPADMPAAIAKSLRAAGRPVPRTPGATARLVLESVAEKVAAAIGRLDAIRGAPLDRVHVVGGGSRNALFSQMLSDATDRPVLAGPAEAAAIGNLLVQAMAAGILSGPGRIREISRRSFPPRTFFPGEGGRGD